MKTTREQRAELLRLADARSDTHPSRSYLYDQMKHLLTDLESLEAENRGLREALKDIEQYEPDNEMGSQWNINNQAETARTALSRWREE